jgi:BMFP domain-containing protein YqiC
MKNNKFKELVDGILSIIPKNAEAVKDDLKDNLKILLNDYLRRIEVVTREEFDIQKEVLLKTRKKLEELEEKLNK